jgi:hypothetical protein
MKPLHGVYFGTRKLPGHGWGIVVVTYRNGQWETTDTNLTPWPSPEVAFDHAKRAAEAEAEREALPLIAGNPARRSNPWGGL